MSTTINITATNMAELVSTAFKTCSFEDGEDKSNCVKVEGIRYNFEFHPERLEQQRELVKALLDELPIVFKKGYTFLEICKTKNGQLWTGFQSTCEQLVVMAIGLDLMQYTMPRPLWKILPGGVPYVILK